MSEQSAFCQKISFKKNHYLTANHLTTVFCLSGEGTALIDAKNYPIKRGDLFIIPPNVYADLSSSGLIIWKFTTSLKNLSPNTIKDFFNNFDSLFSSFLEDEIIQINDYFSLIKNEIENETTLKENIIDKLFNCILLKVANKPKIKGTIDNNPLSKAIIFINGNFPNTPSLKDTASVAGLTENYFCAIFKKKIGTNLIKYIKNAKILQAKKFLTTTKLSVTEIAEKLKYLSFSHFLSDFKELENETPNSFRKKLNNE